jgi:hypothetical protein
MKQFHMSIFAVSALVFGAGSAMAQSIPVSIPGAGNSAKISDTNRTSNSDYNHLIGSGDPKASQSDEPARPKAKQQRAVPATAADIKSGSQLRDSQGVKIGSVESVDADGVVVNTGQTKIKVPLVAFGKDDQGLLLGITASRFNELIAQAHQSH